MKKKLKRLLAMTLIISIALCSAPQMSLALEYGENDNWVENPFDDVRPGSWYFEHVRWAYENGIVGGRGGGIFDPNGISTRAEFVTMLCRLDMGGGANLSSYIKPTPTFADVAGGSWYEPYVEWAHSNGYVSGVGDNKFAPNQQITRQEMARMLYNYLSAKNELVDFSDIDLNVFFTDGAAIHGWARDAVAFAVKIGVINGMPDGEYVRFAPTANHTRAEGAAVFNKTSFFRTTNFIDSDFDDLSDADEINDYFTDPYNADTDGDGVDDGWELFYGTNPVLPDYAFPQKLSTGEITDANPVTAAVDISLNSEQVGTLEITPVGPGNNLLLSASIPGYLGTAYDFEVEGEFDKADISFEYDPALGTIGEDFQPRIYYFDEDTGLLEELPNQRVQNGKVTATVSHFSTYILLNGVEFSLAWAYDIRKPSQSNGGQAVYSDLDVVFVVDESNSMENNKSGSNNDPGRIRVEAVKKFIDELEWGDRSAIVGFSTEPRMLINLTYDHEAAATQADMIAGNMGGTQLYKGINMGIEELRTYGRPEADKIIIALTDGEDDPAAPGGAYDEVIAAAGSDITIYTVGLGQNIATVLLAHIAQSTGGHYFHAETADDLYLGYERIKDETIDYRTDSNNDGISDYYAKLIMRQELRMQNGSGEMFPVGLDVNCSADLDGDGLLNGEELVIVEIGDRVMIRYVSDPLSEDSDGDGYTDTVDPHPLVRDYFSTDTSDFFTLTNDGKYRYSAEASAYDQSFWAQVGNSIVSFASFTDLQQDYTMEMVDFFRINASEQYVNYQQMADMETAVAGANDSLIASICKTARDIVSVIDAGAEITGDLEALTEAGLLIMNAKKNLNEARKTTNTLKSIGGYKSWVTRYVNQFKNGVTFTNGFTADVPAFKMMTKGMTGGTAKRIQIAARKAGQVVDTTLDIVGWVAIAFDAGEVLYDDVKLWQAASAIAGENANTVVFQLNNDLFERMRDSADHEFTRQAAQFVLDALTDSYMSRINQTLRHSIIEGSGVAIDIILMLTPQLWVVGIAKGLFDICDSIWGFSDNAQTRARVICLSDMTEATITFVNAYYLSDSAKQDTSAILGRHLENLVNLRITGETRFTELRGHENDSAALSNISELRALATSMNLFVIP